ncbi:hypothetical protein K469DRAFT_698328 [Zopfia rhizophila CBS 207.26]|uniref:Uncharacterized protein n=1 Tax=Zopfia rhizophila CBS 207.26 TaxID=1314779 RepID=A0A6A6DF86_9PEZI|nr:hypothetical protein K469DRAFT_698328 [Zopfia rhizophila CBS 207.26]
MVQVVDLNRLDRPVHFLIDISQFHQSWARAVLVICNRHSNARQTASAALIHNPNSIKLALSSALLRKSGNTEFIKLVLRSKRPKLSNQQPSFSPPVPGGGALGEEAFSQRMERIIGFSYVRMKRNSPFALRQGSVSVRAESRLVTAHLKMAHVHRIEPFMVAQVGSTNTLRFLVVQVRHHARQCRLQSTSAKARLRIKDYRVRWISAFHIELAAAQEMLDEEHQALPQDPDDTNLYMLCRIGEHNVVVECLPADRMGVASAAVVAAQISRSSPPFDWVLCLQLSSDTERHHPGQTDPFNFAWEAELLGEVPEGKKGKKKAGLCKEKVDKVIEYVNGLHCTEQVPIVYAVERLIGEDRPSIAKSVTRLYEVRRTKRLLEEILSALQSVLINYSALYVVIDAPDECPGHDGARSKLLTSFAVCKGKQTSV